MMETILPGLAAVLNVHPLFVHFPVALLPSALAVELLALWRGDAFLHRMARGLVYMGTLGALVALATGFAATAKMGHETPGHELVHIHRNLMVATTALSVLLSGFLFLIRAKGRAFLLAGAAGLALVVGVLVFGADRGGRLVFKHGIGVRFVTPPASDHLHEHGSVRETQGGAAPEEPSHSHSEHEARTKQEGQRKQEGQGKSNHGEHSHDHHAEHDY